MVVKLPSVLIVTTVCLLSVLGRAGAAELVLDGGSEKGCSSSWSRSIDTVMGGKSSLTYRCDGNVLEAQGYLNIDGGGFAGVSRSLSETIDLGGSYDGIEVTYAALEPRTALPLALELRLGAPGRRANFGSVFALLPSSEPGAVGRVTLPLDSFLPRNTFNSGQSGTTLDASRIGSIAYQLLFQEGDFLFRIVEVKAVNASSAARAYDDPPNALIDPGPAEVIAVIDGTIARGSFAYNQNYVRQCEKVYAASVRQLADALRGSCDAKVDARAALTVALARAEAGDASDNAWELRDGLDGARAIAASSGDSWSSDGVACAALETASVDTADAESSSSSMNESPPVDAADAEPSSSSMNTNVDVSDKEDSSPFLNTNVDVDLSNKEDSGVSINRHHLWSRMTAMALLVAMFG